MVYDAIINSISRGARLIFFSTQSMLPLHQHSNKTRERLQPVLEFESGWYNSSIFTQKQGNQDSIFTPGKNNNSRPSLGWPS